MKDRKLASRYAGALLSVLPDPAQAESTDHFLMALSDAMKDSAEFRDVMLDPAFARSSRKSVLRALVDQQGLPATVGRFMDTLVDNNRLGALPTIAQVFHEAREKALGIVPAEITTATPLEPSLRERTRATLEKLKELLAESGVEIRYGLPRSRMTNLEREIVEMEIMLRSTWLLTLKAMWQMDEKKPNTLTASMSKVRAGDVVAKITQRAVELMGSMGYSREQLLEKWFRDAKINDLYEGTGQINRLIVARQILEYSRHELS